MSNQTIFHGLLGALCSLTTAQAAENISTQSEIHNGVLEIRGLERPLRFSLGSPGFVLDDRQIAGGASPIGTSGTLADGKTLEVSYPPVSAGDSARLEVKLFLRWSPTEAVLRKWARFRLLDANGPRLLKEVVLDRIAAQGRPIWTYGLRAEDRQMMPSEQSQPVFLPGLFMGIEFPIASVRCEEGLVVLAHRPGVRLQPGAWHETRTAVYGVTRVGDEVRTFQQYIDAHRPGPRGLHINYNSWWTAPNPYYTEQNVLELMKVFDEKLFNRHGVALDSFCIDMGWSDPKSIWEIDAKSFPEGFSRLQAAARRMHSNLGLWISPSSLYPTALDGDWAKAAGYETNKTPYSHALCLAGPHYAGQFRARLADLVGHRGIGHLKLDGYAGACPETDHGHQPGVLSSEATAEGLIAAMEAARKGNPAVWIEPTCFHWNPSPWWLLHANSVLAAHGDDAPAGRVPSPIYRESYTTARDFFNLQGAALLPVPIGAQEVLGIVHQSAEPFMNDAVVTVLRGHQFLPLYLNPKFMDDARWDSLAGLLKWARANSAILEQTVPLLPPSWQHGGIPRLTDQGTMPREPYGYAHVKQNAGLIVLRNPWIVPQSYTLKLDEYAGFSPAAKNLSAVSLYPEPRLYVEKLKHGDTLEVAMAPYETVVLSIESLPKRPDIPRAVDALRKYLTVGGCEHGLERTVSAARLTCRATIQVTAPRAELLVLCEGREKSPALPAGRLTVGGHEVKMETASSDAGWSATGMPHHDHWTFLRAPLAAGGNAVSLEQVVGDDCTNVSVWAWATKPGRVAEYPNALPQPEMISLDGATLVPTTVTVAAIPVDNSNLAVKRHDFRMITLEQDRPGHSAPAETCAASTASASTRDLPRLEREHR